jgi:hypothetical protein
MSTTSDIARPEANLPKEYYARDHGGLVPDLHHLLRRGRYSPVLCLRDKDSFSFCCCGWISCLVVPSVCRTDMCLDAYMSRLCALAS